VYGVIRTSRRGRGLGAAVLALLALLAVGAPGARADEPLPGEPLTPAAAAEELDEARAALAGEAPELDVTMELRDLALALPYLRGSERREALALLARPPTCDPSPCPVHKDGGPGLVRWSVADTANRDDDATDHFRIHWVTTGPHAATPAFVAQLKVLAEHAYDVENTALGWPEAKPDNGIGKDDKIDIYLADLCDPGVRCLFGYAAPDPSVPGCSAPTFRCAAYMVLDNDYAEFQGPDEALQATLAHEYNHVLQFAIDQAMDQWVFESTATWIEDHVFPDANDWVRTYVPTWARTSRRPITHAGNSRQYGSAVWNHWLASRFDPDVILDTWLGARKTRPKHFGVKAYQRAVRRAGGVGFEREFVHFAAATAEWRAPSSPFPDRDEPKFIDVRRLGTLRPGRRETFKLNHTAYALKRIKPQGARRLRLVVRAPKGTRSGIALVGRRGRPRTGEVVREVRYLQRGGKGRVTLRSARRFRRITAVVVNADGRLRSKGFRRSYAHDRREYTVALRGR